MSAKSFSAQARQIGLRLASDLFRFRNKLGEGLALEGLKEYLRSRERGLNRFMKFAEVCRVEAIVSKYTKALAGGKRAQQTSLHLYWLS